MLVQHYLKIVANTSHQFAERKLTISLEQQAQE